MIAEEYQLGGPCQDEHIEGAQVDLDGRPLAGREVETALRSTEAAVKDLVAVAVAGLESALGAELL